MNVRFEVQTKDLHEAVKALKAVMPTRTCSRTKHAFTIDTHARIDTEGDQIVLSVLNLSTGVRAFAQLGAKVDIPGSTSVNVRDLCELLATYSAYERADFRLDETTNRLEMMAGMSKTRFQAYPASEFPAPLAIPELLPVAVSSADGKITLQHDETALRYAAGDFDKLPILKAESAAFERTRTWFQTIVEFSTAPAYRRGTKRIPAGKGKVYVTYCREVAPLLGAKVDETIRAYGLFVREYQAVEFHGGFALFRADRRREALFIRPTKTGCKLVWRGHAQDDQPVETLARVECDYSPAMALLMLGKSVIAAHRTTQAASA